MNLPSNRAGALGVANTAHDEALVYERRGRRVEAGQRMRVRFDLGSVSLVLQAEDVRLTPVSQSVPSINDEPKGLDERVVVER
jgi:hypothetical protein